MSRDGTRADPELVAEVRREVVWAAEQRHPDLFTGWVLDRAVEVMTDLVCSVRVHRLDERTAGVSLPDAALNLVVAQTRLPVGGVVEELLMRTFATRMGLLGQPVRHQAGGQQILIPHRTSTPTTQLLIVAVGRDDGWSLTTTGQGAPVLRIHAPLTQAGAATVADLTAGINAGQHGNPFRSR